MTYTIRVHNYAGDWDSLAELHIIGPYATAQDRDRDLDRQIGRAHV